jgi:hypothetical protein
MAELPGRSGLLATQGTAPARAARA